LTLFASIPKRFGSPNVGTCRRSPGAVGVFHQRGGRGKRGGWALCNRQVLRSRRTGAPTSTRTRGTTLSSPLSAQHSPISCILPFVCRPSVKLHRYPEASWQLWRRSGWGGETSVRFAISLFLIPPVAKRMKARIQCIQLKESRPQVRERTEEGGTSHYNVRPLASPTIWLQVQETPKLK